MQISAKLHASALVSCVFLATSLDSWADRILIFDGPGCSGNYAKLAPESNIARLSLENPSWDKRIVSFRVESGKWRLWDGEDFGGNHAS